MISHLNTEGIDLESVMYHAIDDWKEVCIKLIEEAAANA
jgi:hypothetical protein